jgi:spore coat protein JB
MNYRDKRPMGPKHYASKPLPKTPMMPGLTGTPMPKGTLNLFPVDEGFIRGNIFRGIYDPYKNYQIPVTVPSSEQERMLFDVNKYYFGLHELRLYLDNFPNDQEAVNVFTEFQQNYIKAKDAYEARFGALDIEADNLNKVPWNWALGPWPWEGVM